MTADELTVEIESLRQRLHYAEEVVRAIRAGDVDALVLGSDGVEKVYVLEGAEQMYRQLVEGMQEGAGTINGEGLILYCNDRFVSMLGISPPEVLGRSLYSFVGESSRDEMTTAIAACATLRVTISTLLHSHSGRRAARLTFRDLEKTLERRTISFVATDLTQEARAQQQLSIAKLAHRALLGGSLDELFQSTCEEICSTMGVDFAIVFEFDPMQNAFAAHGAWGTSVGNVHFPAEDATCEAVALRSKSPVVAVRLEGPILPAGPFRAIKPASLMCIGLRTIGEPFGVLSAYSARMRDFSDEEVRYLEDTARILAAAIDRKKFEDETVRSRQELATLIDGAPDAIVRFDMTRRIAYINPIALQVAGLEERTLVGHTLDELPLLPELRVKANAALDAVLQTARGTRLELATPDERIFDVRLVPGFDREGNLSYALAVAREVTEQRHAEKEREAFRRQAEQAHRVSSLGRLSATIAHEFNNVLMSIQPFAELLKRGFPPNTPEYKYAVTIADSVARGKRTTDDVLRYARTIEPVRASLEIGPWLQQFVTTLEPLLGSSIRLHLDIPTEPVYALVDQLQIEQVLTNLAINARDAMQQNGSLRFCASAPAAAARFAFALVPTPERLVHISVIDSGPGMPAGVLPHIFEPLFTTKKGGTGLGLAVVHQIVTSHDGLLFVESAPGRGTSFHLFLPRCEADSTRLPLETPAQTRIPPSIRRVAIVEDEPSVLAGVSMLLVMEGIAVSSTGRGRETESLIEAHNPDLLILDVGLPDIDGVDVYFQVAARWPKLPVLFSTGHGDVSRVLEIGSRHVGCLTKPYDLEMLARAIRSLEIA